MALRNVISVYLVDEYITNTVLPFLKDISKYFLQLIGKKYSTSLVWRKTKLCAKLFTASAQEHIRKLRRLVTTYTPDNGRIIGLTMK